MTAERDPMITERDLWRIKVNAAETDVGTASQPRARMLSMCSRLTESAHFADVPTDEQFHHFAMAKLPEMARNLEEQARRIRALVAGQGEIEHEGTFAPRVITEGDLQRVRALVAEFEGQA